MTYKIITIKATEGMTTLFDRASEELGRLVNEAISQGWKPQGGVAVGLTQQTHQAFMFQAMVQN